MTAINKSLPDASDDDDDDDEAPVSLDQLNEFSYPLTPEDHIAFQRRGPSLLVSFDVERDPKVPLTSHRSHVAALAEDMDWSHLSLTSRGRHLFRAPEVISFIDALADSTLFDQFEETLFFGVGAGAHGALSYALAAPTTQVLAVAPLAGLDGRNAPGDGRLDLIDGIDVSARYSPNATNLAVAGDVFVVVDAARQTDLDQLAALRDADVQALVCRDLGASLEDSLVDLGVLDDLLSTVMEGDMTPVRFYRLMRAARRGNAAYLRRLMSRLIDQDRLYLEALAARNVARRTGRKRFARRFEQLQSTLAEKGVRIPDPLPT